MDVKHQNFFNAKRILTVVRSGQGAQQKWAIREEANAAFNIYPPLAFFDNDNNFKHLH